MNNPQYYLYYLNSDGRGMLLTNFISPIEAGDGIARFVWQPHWSVNETHMPLLFPTVEQAETVVDVHELNYHMPDAPILAGRWESVWACQANRHITAE